MFKNAKNSMFNIDEVQEKLSNSAGIVSESEAAIKSGTDIIPIGIKIPIGSITILSDKEDADSTNRKALYVYAVMNKTSLTNCGGMGMGSLQSSPEYKVPQFAAPRGSFVFNLFELLIKRNIEADIAKLGDGDKEDQEYDRFYYEELTRPQLKELLHDKLKENWNIYIATKGFTDEPKDDISDSYSITLNQVMKYLGQIILLLERYKNIEKPYEMAELYFERLSQALAINVIKLVEKGTDIEEFAFTGRIKGIAYEVLANMTYTIKGYEGSQVVVLKKLEINPFYTIEGDFGIGGPGEFSSSLLKVANIKVPMAVYIGKARLFVGDSNPYEKYMRTEDEKKGTLTKDNELIYINLLNSIGSSIDFHKELVGLLIPYGYDLTNSFKAKYI